MSRKDNIVLWFVAVGLLLLSASCASTHSVSKENKASIAELMQEQNFVFEARRAIAQNGYTKDLTSSYSLTVSPDSLIAWLPYFGRAYRAPVDPSKGGIEFTSTDFTYKVENAKEKEWDINITPRDHNNTVDYLTLHVSASGTAHLTVISTHRQPITFYGKIKNR